MLVTVPVFLIKLIVGYRLTMVSAFTMSGIRGCRLLSECHLSTYKFCNTYNQKTAESVLNFSYQTKTSLGKTCKCGYRLQVTRNGLCGASCYASPDLNKCLDSDYH